MNEIGTVWVTCLPVMASTCSLQFRDVLNVDGSDHLDPGSDKVLNILPACGIPKPGRIVIGEAVDDTDGRMPSDQRFDVDRGALANHLERYDLQVPQQFLRFGRHLGLNGANNHVLATLAAASRFVEHAECLANAGCVAEEDLEVAIPGRSLFRLDFPQELFGRSAADLTPHAPLLGFECACSPQIFQHRRFRRRKTHALFQGPAWATIDKLEAPLLARELLIHREIQLEHVHSRFAEETEIGTFGKLRDQLVRLVR